MAFVDFESKLWGLLSSVAADEGLSLYDAKLNGTEGISVFVSGATEKGSGVSSEDCSRLCRRLMVMFEVEGPNFGLNTGPQIDVSSPGVNRHLRLKQHYSSAVGERVKVIANAKGGISIGVLDGFDGEKLTLSDENTNSEVSYLLDDVKRAHIEYSFSNI